MRPIHPRYRRCPHRYVVTTTTGGWYYSAGEVWDNEKTVLRCIKCGAALKDWKWRVMRYYRLSIPDHSLPLF